MKKNRTFSLSDMTLEQIMYIARRHYFPQTKVIELAINRMYEKEKAAEAKEQK